jgi:uncharacterized repeat protein (TIGR01451 family)
VDDARWDIRALAIDARRPHAIYVGIHGNGVRTFSVEPDLKISASVPTTPLALGNAAMFTYRASNLGPYDATNVRVRVQLPIGATNITASSASATCTVTNSVATCTSPILRLNANLDVTVQSTLSTSGNFALQSMVEGDQPDAKSDDNTNVSEVKVQEIADLGLAIAAPASVTRGTVLNYTLTLLNAGPSDSTGVHVSLQMPAGLAISTVTPPAGITCSSTASTVICDSAKLVSNASATIAIATSATSTDGTFSATATIAGNGVDSNTSNSSATHTITVTAPAAPPPSGGGSSGGGSGGGGGSSSVLSLALLSLISVGRMRSRRRSRMLRV